LKIGRPSIAPGAGLLRAMLLQAFYSVRSERQLMEQLDTGDAIAKIRKDNVIRSDARAGSFSRFPLASWDAKFGSRFRAE
jgi:hypothetical protein